MAALRVVVVDNDASLRAALQALLTSVGHEVQTYDSSEAFLASGRLGSTDCLLLDLRMSGMSGLQLRQHLAQIDPTLPVVFMSADVDAVRDDFATSSAPTRFLQKPFTEEDLLEAIQRAARAPRDR